jgi:uncharacterized membrane protein
MMKTARYLCVTLAALFLAGAVVSYVVQFDELENTTAVLAGAATGLAFLAYAILMRERSHQ